MSGYLYLWLALLVLLFAWRAQNLDAFGLSNDEGAHLMWAKLAVDGYPLYQETRAAQQPLFLGWIAWVFRLAGPTIEVGRWTILSSFALFALTLSWLAHRARGWPAALTALILLGMSPLVFSLSRLVMAEVPATALATLSVALLLPFLEQRRKIWLLASGLALGLSLMVKMLNPFVVAPAGLLLLRCSNPKVALSTKAQFWTSSRWQSLLLDGLLWSAGVVIPVVVILFSYDLVALFDQLVAFRSDLRATIPGSWAETWDHFILFLKSHWGFWLLGLGGMVSAFLGRVVWQNEEQVEPPAENRCSPLFYPLVWVVWLVAGMVMLAWHTPLFDHHFVVLLPPLILLGAGFVADVVAFWLQREVPRSVTAILTGVIILAGLNVPSMVTANQETAAIVTGGREAQAIDLLQAVSNHDDFLMGDSQLLIFLAQRRTPPPLGDVALVAIKAGRQSSERMIALTEAYRSPAVVQWSLRLPWLPEYLDWVEANYLARRVWDNDHLIYFAPRWSPGRALPHERHVRLGETLALRGYDINETVFEAKGNLNLKVYWQTSKPLNQDYTVFTQLLDSSGVLVAGWDSQPLGGYFPTSQWPAHEIVTDVVQLSLPPDLPAGNYTLITGLYLLGSLERLSTPEGSDHIVLTTLNLPN